MNLLRVLALACLPLLAWAQSPADPPALHTSQIPALAFGPKIWSVLRLTNTSTVAQSVTVDVYRENGDRVPLDSPYTVAPRSTKELRIGGDPGDDQMGWARLTAPAEVGVEALVESLDGNTLADYPRRAHDTSPDSRWASRAADVQGRDLYFLNAGDQPTEVSFCTSKDPRASCRKNGARVHYPVGPRQALSVHVRRLRRPYFITESSMPGSAVLLLFEESAGIRKVFGSSSDIQFGDALP